MKISNTRLELQNGTLYIPNELKLVVEKTSESSNSLCKKKESHKFENKKMTEFESILKEEIIKLKQHC